MEVVRWWFQICVFFIFGLIVWRDDGIFDLRIITQLVGITIQLIAKLWASRVKRLDWKMAYSPTKIIKYIGCCVEGMKDWNLGNNNGNNELGKETKTSIGWKHRYVWFWFNPNKTNALYLWVDFTTFFQQTCHWLILRAHIVWVVSCLFAIVRLLQICHNPRFTSESASKLSQIEQHFIHGKSTRAKQN